MGFYNTIRNVQPWQAERIARHDAEKDIDIKGFAYAHREAEVGSALLNSTHMGKEDEKPFSSHTLCAYSHSYKQFVIGYWMANF